MNSAHDPLLGSDRVLVFPWVVLAKQVSIGDFCIIGHPARGREKKGISTSIGAKSVIRSHTVIYDGNKIGMGFQTGHQVMVREENQIGNNVSIGTGSIIEHHVIIGDNVRIHSQAFVPEFTVLEEGVWIGPNVVITNALYPLSPDVKARLKGPTVQKGVIIGANATILPGLVLGERCIIGAGAVVTKDVPAGKVVAGNPARIINDIANLPYHRP